MSPMPMRPTAKSSAPGKAGGAADDAAVDAIVTRPLGNKSRNAKKNPSLPDHMVSPTANGFPRRLRAEGCSECCARRDAVMQMPEKEKFRTRLGFKSCEKLGGASFAGPTLEPQGCTVWGSGFLAASSLPSLTKSTTHRDWH
jgi:hypothetical protein